MIGSIVTPSILTRNPRHSARRVEPQGVLKVALPASFGHQRKTRLEIKAHLVTEHAQRAGAGAVAFR